MEFYEALTAMDESKVKKYLLKQNQGPPVESVSRTIVLMDATGSMRPLLQKAESSVNCMFTRVKDILDKAGFP